MRATESPLLATHADCSAHTTPAGYPERTERLPAAVAGAVAAGATTLAVEVDEGAVLRAIERVHAPGYAGRLRAACGTAPAVFDTQDNPISKGSYTAALAAAAASLTAAAAAADGAATTIWVPVRPPGHHALRDRAMGFCFFNNAAIAAEELLARGCGPVAIVDFDVHHGNGTQAHFWERGDVYFLSVHRYPYYPGTGGGDEVGAGRGLGLTRNFPLAAGAGDAAFGDAVSAGLDELVERLEPASWVVSAGFDAHRSDPLGGLDLSDEAFRTIGRALRGAAEGSPIVAVLEGGYDLKALFRSVREFIIGVSGVGRS